MREEDAQPLDLSLLQRVIEADRQRRAQRFDALDSRPATHAGNAYPSDPAEARAFLDAMLALSEPAEGAPVRRLIAPHIDLRLGGEVYARAHSRLAAGPRPDLVIVLGVCHAFSSRRVVACRKDFETPLGTLRCDIEFLDRLEERYGESLDVDQWLHLEEHSIEFQALWLAHHWPEDPPTLAPILLGSFEDLIEAGHSPASVPEIERFITALNGALADEERRVVVIASVDFAHIGPIYDHPAGLDDRGERNLREADLALLEPVAAGDAESFFKHLALEQNARQVCGTAPVYVTLRVGEGPGELLHYGQGRIHPESGSVVSFAALGFKR